MGILLLHAVLLFGQSVEGAAPAKPEVLICTQAVDEVCQRNETEIPFGTDDIYATWVTKKLPKRGSTYVGALFAEDVGAVAPPNTKVLEREFKADSLPRIEGGKNFTLKLHFNKPTNGWPPGKYRVDISQDGKVVATGRYVFQGALAKVPLVRLGLCEQNPSKDCEGVKATLTTDVPGLLAVGRFSTPPPVGAKVTTKWIAVDVGSFAPANTLIDQSVVAVTEQNQKVAPGEKFIVRSSLSSPEKGWPPGRYKAEWLLDGQMLGTSEFQIR